VFRRTPLEENLRRLGNNFLRGSRHAFIGSSSLAFLPLTSWSREFQDQIQFYTGRPHSNPFIPDNCPMRGKRYATVAKAFSFSTSATALHASFPIGAAYFFARLKMPLAGFLWNALLILNDDAGDRHLVPLFRLLADIIFSTPSRPSFSSAPRVGQVFAFLLRNFVRTSQDLFEAADIDGASHWAHSKNVVIPLSGPIWERSESCSSSILWNEFVLPLGSCATIRGSRSWWNSCACRASNVNFWGPLMAGYALARYSDHRLGLFFR